MSRGEARAAAGLLWLIAAGVVATVAAVGYGLWWLVSLFT